MAKNAPPADADTPAEPPKQKPQVIQIVNNIFFVIVFIAIALAALAFGLTR